MPSKVWDNKYLKLPLVVKASSWRFIHDFSGFDSCNGIFVFADAAHHIKYISYANNSNIIDAIAAAIENNKDKNSTLVLVLYTNSKSDSKAIAKILLERYAPINNQTTTTSYKDIPTGTNRIF